MLRRVALLEQALALASRQGSDVPEVSTSSLGHLAGTLPVDPSGRREDEPIPALRVPGWTCPAGGQPVAISLPSAKLVPRVPRRHKAKLCHVPPATDALGEGRRCAGSRLGAVAGGGVGQPRRVWALALKHPPGLPGTLGRTRACRGKGAAGVPKPHPAWPCVLAQALFVLRAMLGWKMPFAPSRSAWQSTWLIDATCAMSPARAWHALAKAGWGHGHPVLGEAVPRGLGHWCEAAHFTALLGAGASSPCCRLSFGRRNVDGLMPYQWAQHWVSVLDAEFTPEMVLSAQHKAAVKAAPLGSGWMPASGMGLPGQGGVPATQEHLWPAVPWPGSYMPPGRAGVAAAQASLAWPMRV